MGVQASGGDPGEHMVMSLVTSGVNSTHVGLGDHVVGKGTDPRTSFQGRNPRWCVLNLMWLFGARGRLQEPGLSDLQRLWCSTVFACFPVIERLEGPSCQHGFLTFTAS